MVGPSSGWRPVSTSSRADSFGARAAHRHDCAWRSRSPTGGARRPQPHHAAHVGLGRSERAARAVPPRGLRPRPHVRRPGPSDRRPRLPRGGRRLPRPRRQRPARHWLRLDAPPPRPRPADPTPGWGTGRVRRPLLRGRAGDRAWRGRSRSWCAGSSTSTGSARRPPPSSRRTRSRRPSASPSSERTGRSWPDRRPWASVEEMAAYRGAQQPAAPAGVGRSTWRATAPARWRAAGCGRPTRCSASASRASSTCRCSRRRCATLAARCSSSRATRRTPGGSSARRSSTTRVTWLGARHDVVPGTGHYVHIEDPDATMAHLEAFLAEVGP